MENFIDVLDIFGNLIGIGIFIFQIFIWRSLKVQSKKLRLEAVKATKLKDYQKLWEHHKVVRTEKPVAFCLSLIPNQVSIKDAVDRFLKGNDMEMAIIEYNEDGLSPEKIQPFLEKLREFRRVDLRHATEIHLFLQGPVQSGTMVGAAFDNWVPIKLYQYDAKSGLYTYWGPLIN